MSTENNDKKNPLPPTEPLVQPEITSSPNHQNIPADTAHTTENNPPINEHPDDSTNQAVQQKETGQNPPDIHPNHQNIAAGTAHNTENNPPINKHLDNGSSQTAEKGETENNPPETHSNHCDIAADAEYTTENNPSIKKYPDNNCNQTVQKRETENNLSDVHLKHQNITANANLDAAGNKSVNKAPSNLQEEVTPIPLFGSNAPKRKTGHVSIINRGEVQLPNGRQNEYYEVDLSKLPQFMDLSSCNILDSQKTGLKLCPETYVLSGILSQEAIDECRLVFYGKDKQQITVKISASLIINPDPKTLWKEVEPSSPFFRKSHRHFERQEGEYGILTAARIRGRSHAQRGAFCEDDFALMLQEKIGYFGLVADGAGSAKFSRLGSKLLAENLPRFLHHFIYQQLATDDHFKRWEKLLLSSVDEQQYALQIMKGIFTNALRHSAHILHQHTLISLKDEDTKENVAIRFRDLYSTCLAFWAYPLRDGKYWALVSYWVGDGGLAVEHDGKFSLLGVPDGGEFSGQTRFFADEELTDVALEKRLRANVYQNLQSVWAFSDGVTDAKFASEKQLENSEVWQKLTAEIRPNLTEEEKIFSWLAFWVQGEHDDRSVCVFEVKGNNNE